MNETIEQHARICLAQVEGQWMIVSVETSQALTTTAPPVLHDAEGNPIALAILHRYIEIDPAALGGSDYLNAAEIHKAISVGSDAPTRLAWSSGSRHPAILSIYRKPKSKANLGGPIDEELQ